MRTILSLLAVACLGLAAVGCDPMPSDDSSKVAAKPSTSSKPATTTPDVKTTK